jgi:hypothetical protein
MSSLPKEIADFMALYDVTADEIWKIPQGSAYAVKHKALERVALKQGITFERPAVIQSDLASKAVSLIIFAKMGDRVEWSTGEAAPYNSKNGYPTAMAEKRGKDRCVLKLLNAHGALYSEDEADDFKEQTKAATLPKKDARDIYTKLQADIRSASSREQLKAWGAGNADRIAVLPDDWQEILRLQYEEMMADLRQKEAA